MFDIDTTIKITKGDPQEVLDVVRTNESAIDLSSVATGKHHLYPEFAKAYGEEFAEYFSENNVTAIRFFTRNWIPSAILDEFAERFPQHEFTVVVGGDDWERTHYMKDGVVKSCLPVYYSEESVEDMLDGPEDYEETEDTLDDPRIVGTDEETR